MIGSVLRTYNRLGLKGCMKIFNNFVLWYFLKNIAKKRFVNKKIMDFKMTLDLDDPGLSKELYLWNEREQELRFIMKKILAEGMTVLDVGGNIGYYPILEATIIGKSGKVYVIEPFPPNYKLLLRNIALNALEENIIAYPLAASDKEGMEHFHIADASNLGTIYPLDKDGSKASYLTGEVIDVSTTDLSTFIRKNNLMNTIDLIRMDTEGAEVNILQGLVSAIEEKIFAGTIIFEAHSSKYNSNNDIKPVLKKLFQLGYHASIIATEDETRTTLGKEGYKPEKVIQISNKRWRGVYTNIDEKDVIKHLVDVGDIRDIRDVVLTMKLH